MAFWNRVREGMGWDRDRDRDERWRDEERSAQDRDYDQIYDRGYGTDYRRSMGSSREYGRPMSSEREYGRSSREQSFGRSAGPRDYDRDRSFRGELERNYGGGRQEESGRYSMYGDSFGQGFADDERDRSGAGAGYGSSRWGIEGVSNRTSRNERSYSGRDGEPGRFRDFDRYRGSGDQSYGRDDRGFRRESFDRGYRGTRSDFDRGNYGYGARNFRGDFENRERSSEGRLSGASYGRGNYDRTDFDNDFEREEERNRWRGDEWDRNRNRW